jgi:hypothetical protein
MSYCSPMAVLPFTCTVLRVVVKIENYFYKSIHIS